MKDLLEIFPYSIDRLIDLFVAISGTPSQIIKAKSHIQYFQSYFSEIKAKTIIVEHDYIDRDFLEDFSSYYVRCFHSYERKCKRLHFFSYEFDEEEFTSLLEGSGSTITPDELKKEYLGFIVLKPLPRTIIGRTCLKTYGDDSGRRNYPIVRDYEINLFGINLSVSSLAFQEQDTVAAACATSALWSAFHGTGKQFQHHIPSPIEITRSATEHLMSATRVFPNSGGLSAEQMAYAIRKVGLEPLLINAQDVFLLQCTVYAYLKGRVPVLLGVQLIDSGLVQENEIGYHAIVVTGFSLGKSVNAIPDTNFKLSASKIDKLYAHDDQVGPFSRLLLDSNRLVTTASAESGHPLHAIPMIMMVPLYHKIRIPFQSILDSIMAFDVFLNSLQIVKDLEWDIYLSTVNDFKQDVYHSSKLNGVYKKRILTRPLPRFIWKASAAKNGVAIFDLVFDATDVEQGRFMNFAIEYDLTVSAFLRGIAKNQKLRELLPSGEAERILDWFVDSGNGTS